MSTEHATTPVLSASQDEVGKRLGDECIADLGKVTWHSSEEDGGPDVGISVGLGSGKHLWLGEIANSRHAEAGDAVAALGGPVGWWLILYDDHAPRDEQSAVLGRLSDDADYSAFADTLAASIRSAPLVPASRSGSGVNEEVAPRMLEAAEKLDGTLVITMAWPDGAETIEEIRPRLDDWLKAALASSSRTGEGGWRPIDSAPKDGADILYQASDGSIGHCHWSFPINYDDDEQACWWDRERDDEVSPVWWMSPLSPPPSRDEATAGRGGE